MPTRRDLANAIRALSFDAVQKANSGHPGAPMGMADMAQVLWNDFLQHNPKNPNWSNRDRFVLSNGHGSMLLYSLLHLTGYDLSIDDLKQFRQLHSKTAGHPEFGITPGVETTTGPLGQGIANAVGMALAEKILAAQFNQPGFDIVDHYTYAFLGDGCLMEGISHEVCSLAGTHQLGKLIALYDDNGISIDGEIKGWFTDNTAQRFEAYNWHVIDNVDGHDAEAVKAAIEAARKVTDKPSLICCKTTIGFGSPKLAGTAKSHGAPLGADEIAAARKQLGWAHEPFVIPDEIYQQWNAAEKGQALEAAWVESFAAYRQKHPELAEQYLRRMQNELPSDWQQQAADKLASLSQQDKAVATRKSSLACIESYAELLPEFIGGSADLTGSNCTLWSKANAITTEDYSGDYLYYGVREFGMTAIMNGLALHGGFIPFAGTFLVFSDYARNAIRMASLMQQKSIYVFTHDSIGLGEDGPTHQPIEHAASLRLIPNLSVWRPCDTAETAAAWKAAIEYQGPTCLLLSRQNLAPQQRDAKANANMAKGGYTLLDSDGTPEAIIIATGSEVEIAISAAKELQSTGKKVRVVSMPATDIFDQQEQSYRDEVLPPQVTARISIEAGSTGGWYKYVGSQGKVIGIDRFGESAPAEQVFAELGLTDKHLVAAVNELI